MTNYMVSVTYNETVNGAVWDVQPPRLVVAAGDVAIYFTQSPYTAPDTDILFSWNAAGAPEPLGGGADPGPFQTLVAFTNGLGASETARTLNYTLWDVSKTAIVSHDPEIVLEPPHP
jgi:hypothetical protein